MFGLPGHVSWDRFDALQQLLRRAAADVSQQNAFAAVLDKAHALFCACGITRICDTRQVFGRRAVWRVSLHRKSPYPGELARAYFRSTSKGKQVQLSAV